LRHSSQFFVYSDIMEPVSRATWTDERLDDLNHRVDELGRRMDDGFNRLHADLRSEVGSLRSEMHAMQRTMIQGAVAMSAAFLAGFGGLAALIATQP
jgi:hypothetical protein